MGQNDTFRSAKWPAPHHNALSDRWKRVRIYFEMGSGQGEDSVDFFRIDWFRCVSRANDIHDAGHHQDRKPVLNVEAAEKIAGKKRDLNGLLAPIDKRSPVVGRKKCLEIPAL
jgi:hypothetical protein